MSRPLASAAGPLRGRCRVPGDKSISHRTALMPLLAAGPCRATGWLDSADTRASLAAVTALGARTSLAAGELRVDATGAAGPQGIEPLVIDCANSGTTARLLLGLLAGWLPADGPGVVLDGDASLRSRPMARVVDPLRRMGARLDWRGEPDRLPVLVRGAQIRGCDHVLPVASAQLKTALLLAGLRADGTTTVRGGGDSRDHTERLLRVMGVETVAGEGDLLRVAGGVPVTGFDASVPGDPSSAAFLLTAAALVPGSRFTVAGVGLGAGRIGFLDVLARAGAQVEVVRDESGVSGSEPVGDVAVSGGELRAFAIAGDEVPGLVDEIPVLAVLAAACPGRSVIIGAEELRHKESDRLSLVAHNLGLLGAQVEERPDGLVVTGGRPLCGGTPEAPVVHLTGGDHRLAMAMAVAALVVTGETALDDGECVAVSYPGFFEDLARAVAD
ncbi:MAG: 3-phosphoshikimate 1-carboxyvinyltransferase [bacterium]|nr:3-phosphoshikimate 1-carboxyvinyltransferase [bacterium]